MIDRRNLQNFDWSVLILGLALSVIGVVMIYSATRPVLDAEQQSFFLKQVCWIGISLVCFFLAASIDYRWFIKYAYPLFLIGIILLIVVLVAGRKGMGAQRWIPLGFFSFQPLELFKLFFIAAVARYLSDMGQKIVLGFKELLKMTLIFLLIPSVLILKQPHLGAIIILLLIFMSMVMMAGTKRRIIIVTIIIAVISFQFIGDLLFGGLADYQKARIIAFIDPSYDPFGVSYHINQSKVSIGSGGFWGKGYLKGTQGPLKFLPEKHTDFIFSVFAEEWGFIGSIVLFLLYLFIILRGFDTASRARDPAGSFLAFGVTVMLAFYFFINIGMTLGILPTVGIPLPFISYGGSALVTNFVALGILVNVRMRRFALFY